MSLCRLFYSIGYLQPKQLMHLMKVRMIYFLRSFVIDENMLMPRRQIEGMAEFEFLNTRHSFNSGLDWNFQGLGKLWNYHLNYFDFLDRDDISFDRGISLILDYVEQYPDINEGKDPYPTSLRIVNWVKFFLKHRIARKSFDQVLRHDLDRLVRNLEYHLLGNHLLENSFALLFGAYYFRDEDVYRRAHSLLLQEMEEQILSDGGHFERSPMYHQTLLHRTLDSINLMSQNEWIKDDLSCFLREKAALMLSWIQNVTFVNGDIPLVNDSAFGQSPSTETLEDYAERLTIMPSDVSLSSSGYRLIRKAIYELFVDVGAIGPDYQPGHAHADTFNFIVYVEKRPFIVDCGTSTYEKGGIRSYERSTAAHNTVEVAGLDSSEVWASFRVARRAYVTDLEESESCIRAKHNGYRRIRTEHERTWQWNDSELRIVDQLHGKYQEGIAYFHFHPDVIIEKIEDRLITKNAVVHFDSDRIDLDTYQYAPSFNLRIPATVVKVHFKENLRTIISFH